MRLDALKLNLPTVITMAAIAFALVTGKVSASDGEPPMAEAVREAIISIAPDSYTDYIWTFIRRGETVKIKGKGPDRVVAIFGLLGADSESPILTLASLSTTAANGSIVQLICNGVGQCSVGTHGNAVSQQANAHGKATSAANGGGNGKGRGKSGN